MKPLIRRLRPFDGVALLLPILDPANELFDAKPELTQTGRGLGGSVTAGTPAVGDDHLVLGQHSGGLGIDRATGKVDGAGNVTPRVRLDRSDRKSTRLNSSHTV